MSTINPRVPAPYTAKGSLKKKLWNSKTLIIMCIPAIIYFIAFSYAPLPGIWVEETDKLSHRPYSTGFYFGQPGEYYGEESYFTRTDVAAVVESCDKSGLARLTQRNKLFLRDKTSSPCDLFEAGDVKALS